MKNVFLLVVMLFVFSSEILSQHTSPSIKITEQTIIKDPQGNQVALQDFITMMESKEWTLEPKKDPEGTNYIQLHKLSAEEQKITQLSNDAQKLEFNGRTLPYFNLVDLEGNFIKTDNTIGKVVVFNFWFASCPPCIKEIPELNEVFALYKNNDAVVFAAVTFENKAAIDVFQEKYKLQYPIVAQQRAFSQAITRGAYPTNVIVNRDGTIAKYISGGMQGIGKQIEAAIEAALNK